MAYLTATTLTPTAVSSTGSAREEWATTSTALPISTMNLSSYAVTGTGL